MTAHQLLSYVRSPDRPGAVVDQGIAEEALAR